MWACLDLHPFSRYANHGAVYDISWHNNYYWAVSICGTEGIS